MEIESEILSKINMNTVQHCVIIVLQIGDTANEAYSMIDEALQDIPSKGKQAFCLTYWKKAVGKKYKWDIFLVKWCLMHTIKQNIAALSTQ